MGQEHDPIAEIARNIAEGGWSSIYDLVSMLTEDQLAELGYYGEDSEECAYCSSVCILDQLIDVEGDNMCMQCYEEKWRNKK